MPKISGYYRPSVLRKKKYYEIEIAGSWQELTAGQFTTAIYMLLVYTKADTHLIRLNLLLLLFERHLNIMEGMSKTDRHTLLEECTRFFYETEPPVKNYYPTITEAGLIPCATDLNNISFGEWCFIATYYNYYHEFKDPKWLVRLIATIYRPRNPNTSESDPNYNGDLRQDFNENLIVKRAEELATLPENIQLAIFQWIALAMQQVKERRPEIFPLIHVPLDENGLPIPQPEKPQDEKPGSWVDIFNDLIGPKFGTPEQLKKTNAMLVLDYLNKEQKTFKSLTA